MPPFTPAWWGTGAGAVADNSMMDGRGNCPLIARRALDTDRPPCFTRDIGAGQRRVIGAGSGSGLGRTAARADRGTGLRAGDAVADGGSAAAVRRGTHTETVRTSPGDFLWFACKIVT